MPAFLVTADRDDPSVRVNGANAAVVFAADEDDALAMVKSQFDGDGNASWDDATVTEVEAAADLTGFKFRIRIAPPEGGPDLVDVTITSVATDDMDDVGGDLVAALNATASIAGAAYDAGTQILTIAAIADGIGDHTVLAELLPPGDLPGAKPIPGGFGTLVHEGVAAAALSITLAADAYVVPQLFGMFRQI